jgi:hypothetical protein
MQLTLKTEDMFLSRLDMNDPKDIGFEVLKIELYSVSFRFAIYLSCDAI